MDASGGQGQGGGDEEDEGPQRTRPEAPQQQPSQPEAPPPLWAAPQNAEPPPAPRSPAPGGPQSPAPGPQAPPPPGPQSPAPGPQSPAGAPPPPGYGGPVPPGGWQQPVQAAYVAPGELASWGSRVGATLLDTVIVFAGMLVVAGIIVAIALADGTVGIVVGIPLGLAGLVAVYCYAPYFMRRPGAHNGQSLGKQIVGIRVVRDNAEPMAFGPAFLREFVVKTLLFGMAGGAFFLGLPLLLDYLWPLWDDQDRALHDMIVSTHVLRA